MYRKIRQTNLSEFHSTVWEKSPKVSTKCILLCCMAIIAIFLQIISLKNSLQFLFFYSCQWFLTANSCTTKFLTATVSRAMYEMQARAPFQLQPLHLYAAAGAFCRSWELSTGPEKVHAGSRYEAVCALWY